MCAYTHKAFRLNELLWPCGIWGCWRAGPAIQHISNVWIQDIQPLSYAVCKIWPTCAEGFHFILLLGCVGSRPLSLSTNTEKFPHRQYLGKQKLNVGSQKSKRLLAGLLLQGTLTGSSHPCVFHRPAPLRSQALIKQSSSFLFLLWSLPLASGRGWWGTQRHVSFFQALIMGSTNPALCCGKIVPLGANDKEVMENN